MAELRYHAWLKERLNTLTRLKERQKPLSRHEKQYVRGVQKRIKSLFDDSTISHEDVAKYTKIVEGCGFTLKQVTGDQPIFYGEITPKIKFLDEGVVGVVWSGKHTLKACA